MEEGPKTVLDFELPWGRTRSGQSSGSHRPLNLTETAYAEVVLP